MEVELSDTDIRRYIRNIIRYDDLINIDPNTLLSQLPVVILYRTGPDYGHWTLLHKLDNGNIEFFDSYGFKPDTEFGFIGNEYQLPHYLWELLGKLSKLTRIHYNQYPLQSQSRGVNTCGRWVILRHLFKFADIDSFKKGLNEVASNLGISYDEFVTKAIP